LARLREDGYEPAVVEKWNPHVRIRQDLFGFADVLAMKPGHPPLLVQATSTGVAARRAKILAEPRALMALQSGFAIEIWGWRKLKVKRGGKATKTEARIEAVVEADFFVGVRCTCEGIEEEGVA
jgi:hypothetical protein